jgi:hypothetical protein
MSNLTSDSKWRRQFFAEHGDYVVMSDYWLLFHDGYKLARGGRENLHWEEPPLDDAGRLKLSVMFHEIKLRLATETFKALKARVLAAFDDDSTPEDGITPFEGSEEEGQSELKKLQSDVRHWRYKLGNLKKQLKETTAGPDWEDWDAARKEGDAERAAQRHTLRRQIQSIKI